MTQISWQYQVNNRAGGYIVTNTDWNDVAGDLRALIDQTTSSTTDNTPLPIGIDLVNDRVYISDPDSTTPEDGNHADTTLSVVGTTTLAGDVTISGADLTVGGGDLSIGTTAAGETLNIAGVTTASGAGSNLVVKAGDATGTNQAGAYLALKPGMGTGNVGSGDILLQTGPAGSSGTSQGTAATVLTCTSGGDVIIANDLAVDTDTLFVDASTDSVGINTDAPGNRLTINDGTNISPTNDAVGQLGIYGSGYSGYVAMDGTAMYIGHNSASRNVVIQTNETDILQVLATGYIDIPVSGAQLGISTSSPTSMATTVESANIYFYSANGRLYWNSSSERSKTDIEDVEDAYADKVLDLRPVWFRSTCRDDRKDWGHYGFIAEEVDLVDQRLVSYGPIPRVDDDGDEITGDDGVTLNELDDDGENVLRPENVQYDRIIPLLINLLTRQEARIAALEAA